MIEQNVRPKAVQLLMDEKRRLYILDSDDKMYNFSMGINGDFCIQTAEEKRQEIIAFNEYTRELDSIRRKRLEEEKTNKKRKWYRFW